MSQPTPPPAGPGREGPDAIKARNRRNVAIALSLIAFVIIVFVVTIVRLGPMSRNVPSRPVGAQARAIRRTAIICAFTFFGMVGAAFAAVPLYKMFCQTTGFDGATRKAEAAPDKILDQKVTVRFDSNVRSLPWTFKADQVSQTVRIGETNLAFFRVTNTSDRPMTGRASYNVVPELAGPYFTKLECFCFKEQTLQPGQTLDFPVVYFIDPRFATDFETRGAKELTLSYTFFPATSQKSAQAAQANDAPALGGNTKARL